MGADDASVSEHSAPIARSLVTTDSGSAGELRCIIQSRVWIVAISTKLMRADYRQSQRERERETIKRLFADENVTNSNLL